MGGRGGGGGYAVAGYVDFLEHGCGGGGGGGGGGELGGWRFGAWRRAWPVFELGTSVFSLGFLQGINE